jgi:selenide,water dikinase
MPIVDDPFDFGYIAAVNAISDIYAMGGKPVMALSILGWPVDKLPAEMAGTVLEGAREACKKANISLAGGHSIDTPEPIFGLAVTGTGKKQHIKANNSATPGCELFLTKPLGIGILTTAQKKGIVKEADLALAVNAMKTLNDPGEEFGKLNYVKSMTDVTGFGLLGHLIEMCEGSGVSAEIQYENVPRFSNIGEYIGQKSYPGGTTRNFKSYGHKVSELREEQKILLCDPQTSGGLLIALETAGRDQFMKLIQEMGLNLNLIGKIIPPTSHVVKVI